MTMKPTNKAAEGCEPMSSNCVIWQGSDIECIDLCKGDSVSEVVFKLATELCTILDILDLEAYDLSCFNLGDCGPNDFTGLLQLLIDQICALNNVSPTPSTPGTDPLKTEIPINPYFYYKNPQGDTVTTMTIENYVITIGNTVATIVGQINTINDTLAAFNLRIKDLEDAPAPTFPVPVITPQCVMSGPQDSFVLLAELEKQFCSLRTSTGDSSAIVAAMNAACAGLNESDQLGASGKMKSIPGWFPAPVNLAQSFSNLWKTICDMRAGVSFIQNNCCDTGCDAIALLITAAPTDPNTLRINFAGVIPSNYVDDPAGSTIEISDIAGGGPQVINSVKIKAAHFDPASPLDITLVGVNGSIDMNVKIIQRFKDPVLGNTCQAITNLLALGTDTCPALATVPSYTDMTYNFVWTGITPTVMLVELWDVLSNTMVQSSSLNVTNGTPSGGFNALTEGTDYKIRLVINGVPCDFVTFTTLTYPCNIPTLNAPVIDYTDPEGDTLGNTIAGWQVEYDSYHP